MNDQDDPQRDRTDNDDGMRIKDPEKFHKTRRLKQIHDAREQFSETYKRAEADRRTGYKGTRAVAAVALDYVRQLEPLVEKSESDLLDKTVKVGPKTVSIRGLLDQGGTVTTRTRTHGGIRQTFPKTDVEKHRMSRPTSLEIVRMCDHWLDEYVDFDIEDADADTWQV